MAKTAKQKLEKLQEYLTKEISKSEKILNDPFLTSNLEGIELGMHEVKSGHYKHILKKLRSL